MKSDHASADPGETLAAAAPQRPPARGTETPRIDWLFRDALRHRQVHPLMELLRNYRQKDAR